MKTAMQKFIEHLNESGFSLKQDECTEALRQEREMIIDAVDYTGEHAVKFLKNEVDSDKVLLGKDYYTHTFS